MIPQNIVLYLFLRENQTTYVIRENRHLNYCCLEICTIRSFCKYIAIHSSDFVDGGGDCWAGGMQNSSRQTASRHPLIDITRTH